MPGPAQNRGGGGSLPILPKAPALPKAKSSSVGSSSGGGGGASSFSPSSYSMSSSQPKSKSGSGIKILWIPGLRKKHHDKGVYKPSNYNIEHKHADRKNEPWSLGGSKSQDDIATGGDKDDKVDLIKSSTPTPTPTSTVLPSASLGVATVNIDNCSESDSEIKLEKCVIKDIRYVVYNIRDSLQSLTSAKENSAHSTIGDGDDKRAGRDYTKNDFDSIERLDDLDGQPKLSHQNGFKPRSTCKKTKEDKAVKCLYYTMMCCECTIS
ncbi:uncharacterized protein LOC129566154 isoform X1 [Sitodiplosis mosellana]|uniref:uncharacterized protein LOC129566154 isoform X1 n=1 Tax=Sitodiplosis mosellana TaxID=263140 RepID=UPI00244508FE|nr:uncharacterized protein LOC129566154 isoform X1 [Sitodiplosis mosellana]XP_055297771.1 uncharacterized protein LOC129566154 isoform X1 [Sitodiplosis mosellana]XP_055297772.1 uncharacterized protein LOC129566154 isoform X1 [Sitodiplosis mosellana]